MQAELQTCPLASEPLPDSVCRAKAIICEEAARASTARFGAALRAGVLTGSLARDEATFIDEGAHWSLLGDADFFLVFQDRAHLPSPPAIEAVKQEVERILYRKGFLASVGLAPVHGSYFRKLPPHIAAYELLTCGRVVWGDRDVLSLVPRFAPAEISLEDAWRLLANRIIEQLEAVASVDQPGDALSRDAQYCTVKLYLDMATSYLVFAGRYLPTYRGREQALRHLAEDAFAQADSPFPLRPFADRVSACTQFKLEGRPILEPPRDLWEDAVHFAHLLWRWELMRLTGEASQMSDSELMFRWMQRQPVKARIRGWASVLRRCGWHRSWRQWPRWVRLGWRASPRYWVYSVATEVFFRLPHLLLRECGRQESDFDSKPLVARLPFLDQPNQQLGPRAWQRLSWLTSLNYRRLLEATTA